MKDMRIVIVDLDIAIGILIDAVDIASGYVD